MVANNLDLNHKPTSQFRLNGFTVDSARSSMPVGTDAIILGGWVKLVNVKNVLEIGSGSGIISMILGKRLKNDFLIDLIDIHEGSVNDCLANIRKNQWSDQMKCFHSDFNQWEGKNYDLIISNPPFFNKGPMSPHRSRANARHQNCLDFRFILKKSYHLLNPQGRLAVILPYSEKVELEELCENYSWSIDHWAWFRSFEHKPFKRILLLLKKGIEKEAFPEPQIITQYEKSGLWHQDYLQIAGNLHHPDYLK